MFHFISSQIFKRNMSPYTQHWSDEEKNFLQVFLFGLRAYSMLGSHLKIPTAKTLKRGLSGIEIKPGFILLVLSALKIVTARLKPYQRLCAVLVDEIKITSGFNYFSKSDQIIGFGNYRNTITKTSQAATYALLFICGISKKWKQVFGVFFSADTSPSSIMKPLLLAGLKMIVESSLTPMSII